METQHNSTIFDFFAGHFELLSARDYRLWSGIVVAAIGLYLLTKAAFAIANLKIEKRKVERQLCENRQARAAEVKALVDVIVSRSAEEERAKRQAEEHRKNREAEVRKPGSESPGSQ
jgi:hypothetical protein